MFQEYLYRGVVERVGLNLFSISPPHSSPSLQGSRLGDDGVHELVEGLLYNHAEQKVGLADMF